MKVYGVYIAKYECKNYQNTIKKEIYSNFYIRKEKESV